MAKHRWEARAAAVVNQGTWCLACSREGQRLGIEAMHEAARERGGECLSEHYKSNVTPLEWRCAQGHVFRVSANNLRAGGWCPTCAKKDRQAKRLEKMHEIAKERGGQCLSEEYIDVWKKLMWQCHRGHVWESEPTSVIGGHWCPVCAILDRCLSDKKRARYLATRKHKPVSKT